MKRCMMAAFIIMAILMMTPVKSKAAFPADMAENPVICRPLYEAVSGIEYYADANLTVKKGVADGEDFVLSATKVQGDAIYGTFNHRGKPQTGWFNKNIFVENGNFEDEYYTVRSAMDVYTDSDLDEIQDTIKKYSGVIVIGKGKGARQVIYQRKKGGYGIGWMDADTLTNTLVYDGREKQTLADGEYIFRCGYQDDIDGGAPIAAQAELKEHTPLTFKISHVIRDNYYIQDAETGKYLTLYTRDKGLSYGLCMTKEPDPKSSLFHLRRANGSYMIQSKESSQFLGQDSDDKLILERYPFKNILCWRVSAPSKMLDSKAPMVFTQYDPAWCGTSYGSEGCMGTAGCGILAPVNAVYALSGQYMDVMELADYAVDKEYRIIGSGTDEGIFKAACQKFGNKYNFSWDGRSGKLKTLNKKLAQGDTAVVHVTGHYVAIVDYDEKTGKYLMLDSNYLPKREDTAFGDWISKDRLTDGYLEAQQYYFFKLKDPASTLP